MLSHNNNKLSETYFKNPSVTTTLTVLLMYNTHMLRHTPYMRRKHFSQNDTCPQYTQNIHNLF